MSDNLFGDLPSAAGPAGAQAPVVLARKWRPRQFAAVVGQDHVVKALQHALTSKRLHHAYLFTGARGVAKATSGVIFSTFVFRRASEILANAPISPEINNVPADVRDIPVFPAAFI